MTMSESPFRTADEAYAADEESPAYQPETPFLETFVFEAAQESARPWSEPGEVFELLQETPFVTAYLGESPVSQELSLAGELFEELYDREMEVALGELVQEVSGRHAEQAVHFSGETAGSAPQLAAQAAEEYVRPLGDQAEALLQQLISSIGQEQPQMLDEDRLDQLFEPFGESELVHHENPVFEQFLKGVIRKAKALAKGAVRIAKTGISAIGRVLPIGPLLNRLKALIRPLLRRVLQFAINRLPAPVRPIAERLRRRFLNLEAQPVDEAEQLEELFGREHEAEAVADPALIQRELDAELSQLLLAADEQEQELIVAEVATFEASHAGGQGEGRDAGELDQARVRLIQKLGELGEGESPQPAFEEFIPAILPALRIGIRVIGRRRVVDFLAGFLANMLNRYVGPAAARPLSQAIVDAGLGLLTLEAPTSTDQRLAAPAAIAAVVEDTVRRVAEAGEALEDPTRLEAEAVAAFNEAVASNFPPALLRSELQEQEGAGTGLWALRPRGYLYKKYTRTFEVTVSPTKARAIRTFGGVTLEAFLRSQHGVTGTVRARVHLYETLAGTYLSRIAAMERNVNGLGPGRWNRLHPLTVAAAGALLGEPGLGRDVGARFLANRNMIAVGQRFYFLEILGGGGGGGGGGGRRPVVPPPDTRTCVNAPPSQAFLTLDGRPGRDAIRLFVYLSETDAQQVAARFRTGNTTGVVVLMRQLLRAAIGSLRTAPSRVRVQREVESLADLQVGAAAAAASSAVVERILGRLIDWAMDVAARLAMDYARTKRDEFLRGVDNPACGVTLVVTVPAPGLGRLLGGGPLASMAGTVTMFRALMGQTLGVQVRPGLTSGW